MFQNLSKIILIGSLAGFLSGALGVGGGVIIVPGLIFLMGFSQHTAQGTSLTMMLPPIYIAAAYNFYKQGYVNITFALILMVTFVIGSILGAKIALNMSDRNLKKIFAFIMVIAGFKMVFS